jgi:hypothetical protein
MSSVLTNKRNTVVETAVRILAKVGKPSSPEAIVEQAIKQGLVKVPSKRNKSYVIQIFQSTLYNNAFYSKNSIVKRTARGKYATRATVKNRKNT